MHVIKMISPVRINRSLSRTCKHYVPTHSVGVTMEPQTTYRKSILEMSMDELDKTMKRRVKK